jgi:hypothetical protein
VGRTCSATVTLYSDPSCTFGDTITTGALSACTTDTGVMPGSLSLALGSPSGGSCQASGGALSSGSVGPMNPYVVCCAP